MSIICTITCSNLSLCNRPHIITTCCYGYSRTSTLGDKSPKSLCWLPDISVQCSIFSNLKWAHVYGFRTICALHSDLKNAFSWCNICKLSLQGETGNEAFYLWLWWWWLLLLYAPELMTVNNFFLLLWLLKRDFGFKSDTYIQKRKWGGKEGEYKTLQTRGENVKLDRSHGRFALGHSSDLNSRRTCKHFTACFMC